MNETQVDVAHPPSESPGPSRALVLVGRGSITPNDISSLIELATVVAEEVDTVDHYGVIELEPGGQSMLFRFGKSARPADDGEVVSPVTQTNHALGSFGIHSHNPREFTKSDMQFIKTIGLLIATTIESQLAVKALNQERNFSESLVAGMDTLLLVLDPDGQIVRSNRACQERTRFALSEIKGQSFLRVFGVPEEQELLENSFKQVLAGIDPVRFESYMLTKDGRRRRINWTYTAQRREDDTIEFILAMGVDNTEFHEAKLAQADDEQAEQSPEALAAHVGDTAATTSVEEQAATGLEKDFEAVQASPKRSSSDRRSSERHSYPFKQFIAPSPDGTIPAPTAFREVQCHDISSRGFSYLSSEACECQQLVVALGTQGSVLHLTAAVKHVTRLSQNGCDEFLVGCEFTGRVAALENAAPVDSVAKNTAVC